MFQRIKNFFYQRKIDKAVKQAVEETKTEKFNAPTSNMKRCACCKQVKLKSDFWKNRTRSDWLQSECKDCLSIMQRRKKPILLPNRIEFYWWYLVTTPRYIWYEINWTTYIIIDVFRFNQMCRKFWKDMVRDKIEHMIRWQNRNNAWKKDEELYYRLRQRCQKQQIQDNEKQGLFS